MALLPPTSMPTIEAIYRKREERQGDGWRAHLGASSIGNECERALWFTFRWATKIRHSGRLLRLFETGQLAEPRFVDELRSIGVEVHEIGEDGAQFSVNACRGHFGGSMDGVALGIIEAPKTWHLVEMKTHNAKNFAALKKDGVAKSKPAHWSQMQAYMHLAGLDRAFYIAANKDTDELYSERVKLDEAFAMRLIAKADRVINAPEPPPGISSDPSFYLCRFCDHSAICHRETLAPRNCRTCLHSTPVDDGQWDCERWHRILSLDEQKAGCGAHKYVPALVNGEVKDTTDDAVVYVMADGSEWRDSECPF